MPQPKERLPLQEQCYRVNVKGLFLNSSGSPSKVEALNVGGKELRYWTLNDRNGMIECDGKMWVVEYRPKQKWIGRCDEYCADYLIVSRYSSNKRHRHIFVDSTGKVGTRTELNLRYHSRQSYKSNYRKTIRKNKRQKIIQELNLDTKPEDKTLHYVPLPPKAKQRRDRWAKQYGQEMEIRTGKHIKAVIRPYDMKRKRYMQLLQILNKHRISEKGKDKRMAKMNRIFSRALP
jgi:hypothetical protein